MVLFNYRLLKYIEYIVYMQFPMYPAYDNGLDSLNGRDASVHVHIVHLRL